MSGSGYRTFFVEPVSLVQRRYEALRAVFVEEQTPQQVAAQFGVHSGTVRNWTSQFRAQWNAGALPPFFRSLSEDGLRY